MTDAVDPFTDLDAASSGAPLGGATGSWGPSPAAAPTPAAPKDPFADLDAASGLGQSVAPKPSSSIGSIVEQVPVGANSVLKSILSGPGDLVGYGMAKLTGDESYRGAGTRAASREMGALNVDPDDRPANTTAERIARGIGEGAGSMILPEAAIGAGGARLAAVAPKTAEALTGAFGSATSAPSVLGNALVGGVSGGAGQAATELPIPDKYKPAAAMAGSLIGGGIGAGVAALPEVGRLGISAGKDYVRPLTSEGQQAIAGSQLEAAASDPAAVRSALEDPAPALVPGSQPTTFQTTGDMGLGALEKRLGNDNRELFSQRYADQNNARVGALQSLQPTGDPADVAKFFSDQLAAADAHATAGEQSARQDAEGALSQIGGTGTPEEVGNAVRGNLVDARSAAKEHETALWNAVDPDGTLANSMSSIKKAGQDVYGSLPKADAANLGGSEATFRDLIKNYNPVEPFSETAALRSNLTQAMRDELTANGRSPTYRRLSMLNDAVQGTINNAIEGQAAQQAHAVATGAMAPEDTAVARLRQVWGLSDAGSASGLATATGTSSGVVSRGRASNASSAGGAGNASAGRPTAPSGDQGLPQTPPLQPNFDQAAADRLKLASAATKDRATTFDQGPVGGALRSQGTAGAYKMLDSKVPSALFQPGDQGAQVAKSYFKAVGDNPEARGDFEDAAALTIRKAAVKDGIVDPAKLNDALAKHAQALSTVPGLKQKFETAGAASQTLADLAAARRQNIDAIQKSAFGKIVKGEDPERVIGSVLASPTGPAQMRKLVLAASANPDAQQGLRKTIVDHILNTAKTNTEAATTGSDLLKYDKTQTLIRKYMPTLRQVFDDKEIGLIQSVAADAKRSNRSVTALKAPGGSDTAQNLAAAKKAEPAGQTSLLTKLIGGAGGGAAAGAKVGSATLGAIGGAGVAVGQHVIGGLREAGMRKVDDLVRDAMLDPDLARALLAKAPIAVDRGSEITLRQQLRRVGMFSAGELAGQRN